MASMFLNDIHNNYNQPTTIVPTPLSTTIITIAIIIISSSHSNKHAIAMVYPDTSSTVVSLKSTSQNTHRTRSLLSNPSTHNVPFPQTLITPDFPPFQFKTPTIPHFVINYNSSHSYRPCFKGVSYCITNIDPSTWVTSLRSSSNLIFPLTKWYHHSIFLPAHHNDTTTAVTTTTTTIP